MSHNIKILKSGFIFIDLNLLVCITMIFYFILLLKLWDFLFIHTIKLQ